MVFPMSHLKLNWCHKYKELDLRALFLMTSPNTAKLFPRVQHLRGYIGAEIFLKVL